MISSLDESFTSMMESEVLTYLALLYMGLFHFIERTLLSALVMDIKKDFNIKNDQYGLLRTAFLMAHSITSLVYAYIGDNFNRRYSLVVGIAIVAVSTIVGSFVTKFWAFLLSQICYGIGASSFIVLALPIAVGIFNKKQTLDSLALFYCTMPVGSSLGYILGHFINHWRSTLRLLFVLNSISILLALSVNMTTIKDETDEHDADDAYRKNTIKLLKNKGVWLLCFCNALTAFFSESYHNWHYYFISISLKGIHIWDYSFIVGLGESICGCLGLAFGCVLSKTYGDRHIYSNPMIIVLSIELSLIFLFPSLYLPTLEPHPMNIFVMYSLMIFGTILIHVNIPVIMNLLFRLAKPSVYSSLVAFNDYCATLYGAVSGPWLVGFLSEQRFGIPFPNPKMLETVDLLNGFAVPYLTLFLLIPLCTLITKCLSEDQIVMEKPSPLRLSKRQDQAHDAENPNKYRKDI